MFSCLHFLMHIQLSLFFLMHLQLPPPFFSHLQLSPSLSHTHSVASLFFLTLSVAFGIQKHIVPFQLSPSFSPHMFSHLHFFLIHIQFSPFFLTCSVPSTFFSHTFSSLPLFSHTFSCLLHSKKNI